MTPFVFVDRDGTILKEPADLQVDSLEKMDFMPGIVSGLKLLRNSGFHLILVSNQDGLGTKNYPKKSFDLVQKKMLSLLAGESIVFEKILICPHFEKDDCNCRKPKLGLIPSSLLKEISLGQSFVLGDRVTDTEFAKNLGIRSVRLNAKPSKKSGLKADFETKNALEACRFIASSQRAATLTRDTTETKIRAEIRLDGHGDCQIQTGIPFFNHMLEQLGKHSGMDLNLESRGDLEVDAHHTVEDVAIVLGQGIRRALGSKKGIRRYGFVLPMDESRSEVLIDLSGRAHLEFEADFKRPDIGGLPLELVEDFFISFSHALKATVHIRSQGRNDHHKVEGIFKAVARTLRTAIEIEDQRRDLLPTTKGVL